MSNIFGSIQELIGLVFGLAALVLAVFGFVDALRHRPDAFTAAGKLSKPIWLAILGVAVALAFYTVLSPFSMIWILAVVGAGSTWPMCAPRCAGSWGTAAEGAGPSLDRRPRQGLRPLSGISSPRQGRGCTADQLTVISPSRHREGPSSSGHP